MSASSEPILLFCEILASSGSGAESRDPFPEREHLKNSLLRGVEQSLGHSVRSESCALQEVLDRVRGWKRESVQPVIVWIARDSIGPESLRLIETCASEIGGDRIFFVTIGAHSIADGLRKFHHYVFPDKSPILEREFWRAMNDLVEGSSRVLRGGMEAIAGPSVFLAPVSDDVAPLASRLRHDLESRGFHVVSSYTLSELERMFSGCELSVHLFGKGFPDPDAARRPMEYFDAALAYAAVHHDFRILGWTDLDPGSASTNVQLVNQILGESREFSMTAEVVQCNSEDFKSLLFDRLGRAGDTPPLAKNVQALPATSVASSGMEVYVIYDRRDTDTAAPITSLLQDHGLGVLVPEFPTDQSQLRAIHNENLRRCDAALIIYGGVQEQWVRMKQQDLLRSPALGRKKNLSAKGVFLCSAKTEGKIRFSAPGMMIMNGFDSAQDPSSGLAALAPFLQRLSAT